MVYACHILLSAQRSERKQKLACWERSKVDCVQFPWHPIRRRESMIPRCKANPYSLPIHSQ